MDKSEVVVELHQCVLIVEESRIKLTMKVARQLPVYLNRRRDQCENLKITPPDAICKVMQCTLLRKSDSQEWLYLVNEPGGVGLYWTRAFAFNDDIVDVLTDRGIFVDKPESVPTTIL